MAISIQEIVKSHPCFALGKPNNRGRIHLPVSPGCNIGCRFCKHSINSVEQRPGVTARILTPVEALDVVNKALALSPELSVVGIAGPGDTLVTPYAFQTFRLVGREFPELIKCLSTNGLLLADRIEEISAVGIDTLTVTVNDIYPETLARICGWIAYKGKVYKGISAAEILIANQLKGLSLAAKAGITIKVNTVLIPEINGGHIEDIAKAVKNVGADIFNIIPLIPMHEFASLRAPNCAEIDEARVKAEKHIAVFRHCQHCRADAVGVPGGRDYGEQIYLKRLEEDTFSHG
jgi:nitrogen fixation protein NifB